MLLPYATEHPELIERFLREGRAAVQIRSEHVARVLDVGRLPSGTPFLVMEYLEGMDLAALLKIRGFLPANEACEYVLQACEAIGEAHALGIIHRDLKPANLFLTHRPDGSVSVKVLDFGISKMASGVGERSLTQAGGGMMGTVVYAAPEQIRNAKGVDVRADIWSLGAILYELLTGALPFMGDSMPAVIMKVTTQQPRPMRQQRPELPEEIEAVVMRCLMKDREHRTRNVSELASALTAFAPLHASVSAERVQRVLGLNHARPGVAAQSSAPALSPWDGVPRVNAGAMADFGFQTVLMAPPAQQVDAASPTGAREGMATTELAYAAGGR
jgi:serine/threonine protein kinase